MELKYIIIRNREGHECGIVFDKKIIHRDVARLHSASNGPWVVSAGFCSPGYPGEATTAYGEGESLGGMKSRPEDASILHELFKSESE